MTAARFGSSSINGTPASGYPVAPSPQQSCRRLPLNPRFAQSLPLAAVAPSGSKAAGASPLTPRSRSVNGARVAPSDSKAAGASPSISLRSIMGLASPPPAAKLPEPPPQSRFAQSWGSRRPLPQQSCRSLPLNLRFAQSMGLALPLYEQSWRPPSMSCLPRWLASPPPRDLLKRVPRLAEPHAQCSPVLPI